MAAQILADLNINPTSGIVSLNAPLTFYRNDLIDTTTPGNYSLSGTDTGGVGAWPPGSSFPNGPQAEMPSRSHCRLSR